MLQQYLDDQNDDSSNTQNGSYKDKLQENMYNCAIFQDKDELLTQYNYMDLFVKNMDSVITELKKNITVNLFDSITIQLEEEIILSANLNETIFTPVSHSTLDFDCLDSVIRNNSAPFCTKIAHTVYFEKDFGLDNTQFTRFEQTIDEQNHNYAPRIHDVYKQTGVADFLNIVNTNNFAEIYALKIDLGLIQMHQAE